MVVDETNIGGMWIKINAAGNITDCLLSWLEMKQKWEDCKLK